MVLLTALVLFMSSFAFVKSNAGDRSIAPHGHVDLRKLLESLFAWLAVGSFPHKVLSLQCSFLKMAVASLRLSPGLLTHA